MYNSRSYQYVHGLAFSAIGYTNAALPYVNDVEDKMVVDEVEPRLFLCEELVCSELVEARFDRPHGTKSPNSVGSDAWVSGVAALLLKDWIRRW